MPSREPTSRALFSRRHVAVIGAVLVVVAGLAVVTALGGWARSTPEGPQMVAPGAEIEATPFQVTLDKAAATYEASGREAAAGQAFLVVEGTLSLASEESVGADTLNYALFADLPHGYKYGIKTEDPPPEIMVAEDGVPLIGMGPGLTYDVQFTFTIDEADVPDELTVVVLEHVWRRSSLDGFLGWFDPAPVAHVSFDVAPLPDERPVPEEF